MVEPSQVQEEPEVRGGPTQFNFKDGMQANIYPAIASEGGVREMMNFELATRYPNPVKQKGYKPETTTGRMAGVGGIHHMNILYGGVNNQSGATTEDRIDYVTAIRASSSNTQLIYGYQRGSPNSTNVLDSLNSINAMQSVEWPQDKENWLYLVGAGNVKMNGSTVHVIGNIGPSTGFSATGTGTGSINGTTKIRVAYVYGDFGESNLGDSVSITVTNKNIKLESIPVSSSALVTKRKIYRTDERTFSGRSGEDYWLAKTIDDNSTTMDTLTTKGSVLIANQAKPADNSTPPDAQMIERFANRVWYAGGSIKPGRLIYSKELKPDQYEDPNNSSKPTVIDSIRQDDDIITGLAATRKRLYVFTPEKMWVLRGRNTARWEFHPVHEVGTLSPDSVVTLNNQVYFLGSDRKHFYVSNGRELQPLTQEMTNFMSRIDWDHHDRFWTLYNQNRNEIELHVRHLDYNDTPVGSLVTGSTSTVGGSQKYSQLTQQRWLHANEQANLTGTTFLKKAYPSDPKDSAGRPNLVIHFNLDTDTVYLSDRGANSGTMRSQQKERQRPLTERPFPGSNDDSQGLVVDVYGSLNYVSTTSTGGATSTATVYGRMDLIEREGEDPMRTKLPRRTYMTAFNRDSANNASVIMMVSGDYGQSALVDSTSLEFSNDLNEQKVWWGNHNGIEGNRHQFRVVHDDSNPLVIEGIASEYRERGRR